MYFYVTLIFYNANTEVVERPVNIAPKLYKLRRFNYSNIEIIDEYRPELEHLEKISRDLNASNEAINEVGNGIELSFNLHKVSYLSSGIITLFLVILAIFVVIKIYKMKKTQERRYDIRASREATRRHSYSL